MSGEINRIIKETECVSENSLNTPEKKEQKIFCDVCKIHCFGKRNFADHIAGKKHLKKLNSPPQQNTKEQASKKKKKTAKKTSDSSPNIQIMSHKDKNQNIQDSNSESAGTMNNSNKFNQNNRYSSSRYENRYPRNYNSKYYPNSYRNNYNNKFYHGYNDWNSHSNSDRSPTAERLDFNYGSKHHFYSRYDYNASRENEFPSGNSRYSYRNPFSDYGESSNTERSEQNLEHDDDEKHENRPFSLENPFRQYMHNKAVSSPKPSEETLCTESTVLNTTESTVPSEDSSVTKKSSNFSVLKFGGKRIRSRSLSATESDKKGKDKTDQAESVESEEQRIQEWTNSLLETNHNQITRLINPSNHKEKAAVNHLITKFSKSKRKEILSRTLSTNSLELVDNDDKDVNNETNDINAEDEEISIILDSNIKDCNVNQSSTNHSASYAKSSNSKLNKTNQGQNNLKILKSSRSVKENSKINSKSSEDSKGNSFASNEFSPNSSSLDKPKEKYVKRKSASSDGKSKKKQKTASLKDSNAFNMTETENLNKDDSKKTIPENFVNRKTSIQDSSLSDMNKETAETIAADILADPLNTTSSENKSEQNLVFHPDVSVDTLIELFASGNVKVKEEFNDPLMDALKEMNEDELINACSNNPLVNASEETVAKASTSSANRKDSRDKSPLVNTVPVNTVHVNKRCLSPVILGSAAVGTCSPNESTCSPSVVHQTEPVTPVSSTSDKTELNQPLSSSTGDGNVDHSLNEVKTKLEMPPYLNKLIKQLQNITSEEEIVKQNLTDAKLKINEYNSLLDEWKKKKKLLLEQEEDLRKQRNNIINLMQNSIKTDDDDDNKEKSTSLPKDDRLRSNKAQDVENSVKTFISSETSCTNSPSGSGNQQQKSKSPPESPESDEITILPSPQKVQPLEIIICDDEENTPIDKAVKSRFQTDADVSSNRRLSAYDLKNVKAHTTIVNCLVVFEDYLYTCSNEYTAKRFSLKDSSLSMTYTHSAKNVTEIVVEKMQNEALVFTACSSKIISLFIASSGTKIKSFFPPCAVTSICKGWGKFYAGLANGAVNMYNWKYDEYEIVKTDHHISCLATAHQGRLHVLVILSAEGNISITDAETGLLIRYVKIYIKHPAIMCLHNDLVYLSSADKSLTILDIMSGRMEKKIYMSCHTTGLAVYDDFIFTIYYNGVINCYNKDNSCEKKIFYGVGKGSVTCIHVHQNWVFTGNRKGYISSFHFDPSTSIACEFSKCDAVYGLKEDLDYHIENDHLLKRKNWSHCPWRGCDFMFPGDANTMDKMNHLKSHVYQMDDNTTSNS